MSRDRFVSSSFFVEIEAPSSFLVEIKKESPMKGVANLRIQKPDSIAKRPEREFTRASKKSRPVREPVRAQSVESLSASDESEGRGPKESVLVPTIGEQIMLARIIDEEREYDRQGRPIRSSCTRVLPKNKDKEKVTFAEGSSSNSGLDSRLQGLEERILEFMGEGFVGLHVTVETKLEALGSRMSHIEKNQRIFEKRAKKMEDKLTSIESKWDYGTYEEKEKANSEKDKANAEQEAGKENDNIENTEQEAERKNDEEGERKEADDNAQQEDEKKRKIVRLMSKTRKTVRVRVRVEGKEDQEEEVEGKESETREQDKEKSETDEVESEAREAEIEKGTPTPPRGNQTEGTPTTTWTKAMAARRLVTRTMEGEPGKGVEAGETEGKSRKKIAEEEKKEEETVKAGEIVEEYTEEEKQRLIMEAPSPWIMHRCKENAAVAVPKKSGRPKEEITVWVQTPFTEGKNVKQSLMLMFGKLSLQVLPCPKMSKMDN
ncbi:LOW QUALITY PROTEIN: hypothetical protein HID58_094992 [Brassica napus]|uniref:Uncharacterized protein n=1 Tax=Brassica napus TaxID=3708 RepID=A0ABQ7X7K1_BRANA|nr:LOW QUALITY PROTEIN: hypothetical protein HID58_094992 [Brassica napus]